MQPIDSSSGFLLPSTERQFHRSVRALSRFANLLAIVFVPLILSVWLTVVKVEWSAVFFWGGIGSLALLQATLFWITTQFGDTVPELHMDLREQEEVHEAVIEQLNDAVTTINWLEAARTLGAFWTTAQGLLSALPMGTRNDLSEAARLLLEPMIGVANHLFGFEYDDAWSIAVYEYQPATETLSPLWYKRSDGHPSEGDPRRWRPGDGHVGSAFMQERILFTTDAASEDASPLLKPSIANERPYDGEAYRSFVSAPILLGIGDKAFRYGVLVLTSNVAGRFDDGNQDIVAQAADALAHAFNVSRLAQRAQPPYGRVIQEGAEHEEE